MNESEAFIPPARSRGTKRLNLRSSRATARGHLVANGRIMSTESGLEFKAALVLLSRPDVVDLWEQPPGVRYVDESGKAHFYTFDFLATRTDGRRSAFEVKPERFAQSARTKVALIAAQASWFADTFHVLTEKHLGRDAVHDARLVYDMRRLVGPAEDAAVERIVATLAGATTIARIVEVAAMGPEGFAAVIRAIGAGTLVKVGRDRLSYASLVRPANPEVLP